MEYLYTDMCIPNDHHNGHYIAEYVPPFTIPTRKGEYEVRSSVLVDGGDRFGVSAVVFDKYEELLWMGNQGGHVTSYYGPNMQKYTSFQVHETDEVRDIVTLENSIYILTKTILRNQIRRGIPKQTYRSKNMIDMQCLYQVSSTNLLMGGHQDKLLDLDLTKMNETVIPIKEEGCAVLRSGGGSVIACGSASGVVALRDLRTPANAEHTFRAHTGCLSDLDMHGDLLLTCGFSQTAGGAVVEPYVVIWDVRHLRTSNPGEGAWSIQTPSPPLLLHFLPAFSGRAVAVSGDGHVALLHVNSPNGEQSVFQVDTQNSQCSVIDVSSTSQALAFADQSGHMHLFSPSQNHEPVFNNFSRATEFADSMPDLPRASLDDKKFRFTSIPLPPLASGSKWFNELPPEFFKKVYRKPKPIDPDVLKTMKMQGPIGHAPNPGTFKRNQMPYIQDTMEDLKAAKLNENKPTIQPIPRIYQKIDTRYAKHSLCNGESEDSNKTGLPGLEATVPNSYCNPMLQVLYYTAPVKATLLAHSCAKEFCLSCELGFLFRTLDVSGGVACQAGKFLRAFRTVPEAAALGLILPDRALDMRHDVLALIQSWNRFILHQIHYEILDTRKKEKELVLLANSPPKPSKMMNHVKSRNPTHLVNGQYSKDQNRFTELEFLGPTELGQEDQAELCKTRPEEGNGETEHIRNHENHELNNQRVEREETEISQLFAISRHQLNRCLKCNKEEGRESVVLACALQYPHVGPRDVAAGSGGGGGETRGGFAELVRASLAARRSTPAWCEQCARFTPTTQRGRVVRLPPILAINCGGVTVREKAYWAKGTQKDTLEAKRGGSGSKPCRYGLHCSRPGCHFKHPDRPSPSSSASKSPSPEAHCVLPHQLLIRLQSDGDVIINDKDEQSFEGSPTNRADVNKHKKRHVATESLVDYRLKAAVVCVEDSPKNLVAYIRTSVKDNEPQQWYLFNDLCISAVSADEVVQFGAWWKTPCVLFYMSSVTQQLTDHPIRS